MLNLIPYPSGEVKESGGFCVIPAQCGVQTGDFQRWALIAFENRMHISLGEGTWLQLKRSTDFSKEGYLLEILPDGIRVEAAEETGIIWALTTAVTLYRDGKFPCCRITDQPKFAHRGLNLDCARHFFPAKDVTAIIEELSLTKMNVLHWHLSDDQGWRIESKKFPKLHKKSKQYYTAHEIRSIVEFARLRGVEIIPEIALPGHTTAILAAYPGLSCGHEKQKIAQDSGIFPVILCAGQDTVFDFLEELLDEIIPLFPGKYFHIGGDDVPKSEWQQCPHCNARMQALGITKYEDLQGDFTRRVMEILKKHGKEPICRSDILSGVNIPGDVAIQYWVPEHRQSMEKYVNQGGNWIYSDMFDLNLDYPYSMSPLKKIYSTVPQLGRKSSDSQPGLLGMEACLWTERVDSLYRLETLLFPRIHALAEISWSGKRNYKEFQTRLEGWIGGSLHSSIAYTEKGWWDPAGKKRRKEALEFIRGQKNAADAPKPGKEFRRVFLRKFFRPADLLFLRKEIRQHIFEQSANN